MVGRKYFEGGSGTMKSHHGDFALACKLAFYTGGGYDQMRRIFPKSSLVREKTLETGGNSDYLEVVLRHAIGLLYVHTFDTKELVDLYNAKQKVRRADGTFAEQYLYK